jgi:hypothetical protein
MLGALVGAALGAHDDGPLGALVGDELGWPLCRLLLALYDAVFFIEKKKIHGTASV